MIKKIETPWGYMELLECSGNYWKKNLIVFPNKQTSLQSHAFRSELWWVVEGEGEIVVEDKVYKFNHGILTTINIGEKHRIRNIGKNNLVVRELAQGDKVVEEDIIRYEDDYGRGGAPRKSNIME